MKRLLFSILFHTYIIGAGAQSSTEVISLAYNNETIEEVFILIEKQTSYKFYFHDKWIDDKRISGIFNSKPVAFIVEQILKETRESKKRYLQFGLHPGAELPLGCVLPQEPVGRERLDSAGDPR